MFDKHDRAVAGKKASIRDDTRGVVAVYVALIIAVLLGLVGLTIDFSRFYSTNTQAQQAADAAALAAATQLDGGTSSPSAIERATEAAMSAPRQQNRQDFATNDEVVTITDIKFMPFLPDDDQSITVFTTDPEQARFVQVKTEVLTHENWFLRAIGVPATGTTQGVAVAGYTPVICRFPPLMICNPFETATNKEFDIDYARGKLVLAKTKGKDAAWNPGQFGLLDPPDGNSGAANVANLIAVDEPRGCYSTRVNIRTGEATMPVASALNVRFDVYEPPMFSGKKNDASYRPAKNVTKGTVRGSGNCDRVVPEEATPPIAMALPRDACFVPGSGKYDPACRTGYGDWDRAGYWAVNHGDSAWPTWPPAGLDVNASRYDVYLWEIQHHIPDNSAKSPMGENGNPICYSGGGLTDDPDRRALSLAVINCLEEDPLHGASEDVRTKTFVEVFLTEPAKSEESASITDVWLEFVREIDGSEEFEEEWHDIVQLYR